MLEYRECLLKDVETYLKFPFKFSMRCNSDVLEQKMSELDNYFHETIKRYTGDSYPKEGDIGLHWEVNGKDLKVPPDEFKRFLESEIGWYKEYLNGIEEVIKENDKQERLEQYLELKKEFEGD